MAIAGWLLACLVGGVFTLVGVPTLKAERRRAATGTVTDGVVVGHEWRRNSGRGGSHLRASPVIDFTTSGGTSRRFTDSFGLGHPLAPGTPVKVRYDPMDPAVEPVMAGAMARVMLPAGFTVLGVLVLLGAAVAALIRLA